MESSVWVVAAVLVKAATYAATFTAAGGVFFILFFSVHISSDDDRRFQRWVVWLSLIALSLSLIRIALTSGILGGEFSAMFDASLIQLVMQSSEGGATLLRIVGLLLICGLFFPQRAMLAFAVVGALFAAASFAFTGHTIEVKEMDGALSIVPPLLVGVHLVCIAFWIGSLYPLLRITYGDDVQKITAIMHRFGKIATLAVGLVLVSGLALLWMLIGGPELIWQSGYGRLFVFKLATVAMLLALAASNKFQLTPRLLQGDATALASLRDSIRVEMALALLILLITATITTVTGAPNVV